jgi:hypothetical protein
MVAIVEVAELIVCRWFSAERAEASLRSRRLQEVSFLVDCSITQFEPV